jgi:hypothetical protein
MFYTHMLLLFTYYHLYWRNTLLQDLYMNTVENQPKGANQKDVKR